MLRGWWFVRRPQTRGAAVALWDEGKVLLVRTSYRGSYALPGGFVRKGESSERAARRELREEVGLEIPAGTLKHAWSGTVLFEARQDTVDIWETSMPAGVVPHVSGREIIWAGWMSSPEALTRRLLPHLAVYLTERSRPETQPKGPP